MFPKIHGFLTGDAYVQHHGRQVGQYPAGRFARFVYYLSRHVKTGTGLKNSRSLAVGI